MPGKKQPREVTIECSVCKGYGIIISDGNPVATVCAGCRGKGSQTLIFEPFTGRKKHDGITHVRRAGQGIAPFGRARKRVGIPYPDFLKGKTP